MKTFKEWLVERNAKTGGYWRNKQAQPQLKVHKAKLAAMFKKKAKKK